MASSFNRSYGGTSNEPKTNDHSTSDYVYNPYRDFHVPIESLYRLPTSPEFLFQEEAIVHRRSASENITFYTGSAYLAGALAGAGKGLFDGLRTIEPGDTLKLRVNRVLNASGDTGRRFGNRFGAIGLIYSIMESTIVHYRDSDDGLNAVLAGLGTGAFYRAASGPRSAAIAGAIGGVAAGLAVVGKQVVKRYVPI